MATVITPALLAASGTEHAHQTAYFCWLRSPATAALFPTLAASAFAIPNGGTLGDSKRSQQIRGNKMKAEGLLPGVSDILIAIARHGRHGLFIEMKKPKGKPSQEQLDFGKQMIANGYAFGVRDTWEGAVALTLEYLTE